MKVLLLLFGCLFMALFVGFYWNSNIFSEEYEKFIDDLVLEKANATSRNDACSREQKEWEKYVKEKKKKLEICLKENEKVIHSYKQNGTSLYEQEKSRMSFLWFKFIHGLEMGLLWILSVLGLFGVKYGVAYVDKRAKNANDITRARCWKCISLGVQYLGTVIFPIVSVMMAAKFKKYYWKWPLGFVVLSWACVLAYFETGEDYGLSDAFVAVILSLIYDAESQNFWKLGLYSGIFACRRFATVMEEFQKLKEERTKIAMAAEMRRNQNVV